MKHRIKFVFIISIVIFSIVAITLFVITINLPYYPGFESSLNYLSPDLSENRIVLRDTLKISKSSEIKLVFEAKDNSIVYNSSQFYNFIDDLVIQIWNDSEFYEFNKNRAPFFGINSGSIQIPVGNILSKGEFSIYIKSDNGVNGSYHIGVGIGQESIYPRIGLNVRRFY